MKKKVVIGLLSTTALVSIALQSTEALAVNTSSTSKGSVDFSAPTTQPDTIKPGTEEKIVPEDDVNNKGKNADNVWLLYVPSFNFGSQEINYSSNKEYNVKNIQFQKKDDTTKTNYEIPQFLQVADQSGTKGTKWKVSAYQESAFAYGTSSLPNTRIRFYGKTLTNNIRTDSSQVLNNFGNDQGANYATLNVGSANAIDLVTSIASTDDDKTTNGTTSSLVLKNNYKEEDYGKTVSKDTKGDKVGVRDENTDVKLFVPFKDTPQNKAYEATIKWTLTVTP